MLFSVRLPLGSLVELCRALRHYLHGGLTLREAFRNQSKRGPGAVRPVAARIADRLDAGESLADALSPEERHFPPLWLALASVGEETGMLAEVFGELEKHYIHQLQLRRSFIARITWPVVQFLLAVFVLAGLILFLGVIARSQGPGVKPFDPLGLGLSGESGALIFLGCVFGTLAMLALAYLLAVRVLRQGVVDGLLLRVPAVGSCMMALALARFCTALRLTMETALPIGKALKMSLRVTGNSAFAAQAGKVGTAVRRGNDLVQVLAATRLFPEQFLESLRVGEESGQVPEVLRRLGEQYHEESESRLAALAAVAGYGIWIVVAVTIVVAIFRIFSSYVSLLG